MNKITNEWMNKWTETKFPWLTIQMLISGPEISSSYLIIACLLCRNQNLTLNFWDFVFSHSQRQRTRFDLYSPIVLSNVVNMAEQLNSFTQDPRNHLTLFASCALSNIQYIVQLRLQSFKFTIQAGVLIVLKLFTLQSETLKHSTNYNEILNIIHQ